MRSGQPMASNTIDRDQAIGTQAACPPERIGGWDLTRIGRGTSGGHRWFSMAGAVRLRRLARASEREMGAMKVFLSHPAPADRVRGLEKVQ